jgi:DNA-binding transcriptional regulator YdaS (Cro superfamily)
MKRADLTAIIDRAGGHKAVADQLGISVQAVYAWQRIPPGRVLQIAALAQMRPSEIDPVRYPPGMVA